MILEGIRILDFSRFAAAPLCTALLANMGAEVVKVERPGGEEDRILGPFTPKSDSIPFTCYCHHKKAITLDLMEEEGYPIAKKLIELSDIVVHNFTPRTKEADLLKYDELKKIKPSIIVVAVTGFGQYGPYAERVCLDTQAQALSGTMSFTGFPGQPPTRAGIEWVDLFTASNTALGTLFALYWRDKTGEGQLVDISLVDNAVYAVANRGIIADYRINKTERSQLGNESWYVFANCFKTKNGWIVLNPATDSLWKRFVRVIGRKELAQDQRFASPLSRFVNRESINQIVSDWFAERSAQEVSALMENARVPCSVVYSVAQVSSDPHVLARGMIREVESPEGYPVSVASSPFQLSLTPAQVGAKAPKIGEHNEEIYHGLLGLSPQDLLRLREKGVI